MAARLVVDRAAGRDAGVAVVTLDDPARRNALDLALVAEIVAAFDDLERDRSVGAVVVTGAPPAFCAGADLGHLGSAPAEGIRAIYEGFLRVWRCPLPTIAAVNGAAVGAGMNLALVCDVRLAGRSARFVDRFLDLGLHPGGGHTWMLDRLCGPQVAAAMVLFGDEVDGAEAERIGLVHRCVDDAALLDAATAMAARAASAPRQLAREAKATLRSIGRAATSAAAVEAELAPQLRSLARPDFAERLAALQRRPSPPRP